MTKITAPPIPAAVSVFLDTPKNGQIPKNWLNTTLLTTAEPIAINNNVFIRIYPPILIFFRYTLPNDRNAHNPLSDSRTELQAVSLLLPSFL